MAKEKTVNPDEAVMLDLTDIVRAVWASRWFSLLFLAIGALIGIYLVATSSPKYSAHIILSPGGEAGSSVSGLGSALQAFGISGGQQSSDPKISRLKVLLSSVRLAGRLDERHNFLRLLYGGQWNKEKQLWKKPDNFLFNIKEKGKKILRRPGWSQPNLEKLANVIGSITQFSKIEDSDYYKIEVSAAEPALALKLLKTVISEAEILMREQDLTQARQRKDYLLEKLQDTQKFELRTVLLTLLEREEQKLMLLETGLPYIGQVIDGPVVYSRPILLGITKGIGLSVLITLLIGEALFILVWLVRKQI